MNDKYSISEMSKFFNIPRQTLRYYDEIGLFKPNFRDENNGYRYYEYRQFSTLHLISKLKKLGFSLKQIKYYVNIKNINSLKNILLERRELIRNEIRQLHEIGEQNEMLLSRIEFSKKVNSSNPFEIRKIPERYQYKLKVNFPIENLNLYIKILYTSYMNNINNEPIYKRGNIVLEIDKNNIINKNFDIYNSIGFFVKKDENIETDDLVKIEESPYAIAYHIGEYKCINRTYKKLCEYIKSEELIITGNAIETAIIDSSIINNPEEFITEIQIPIKIEYKP